jgi:hypothetical protein
MQLLFSAKFRNAKFHNAKFHKMWAMFAAAAVLFGLSARCLADPITLTSSAVSSTLLGPSSDFISLNAGAITTDDSGATTFQTGDFLLGDSEIPNQIIPFFLEDTLTLNGITEIFNNAGQDNVTTTADTLTIFAGAPVAFGGDYFTLQSFSTTGTAIGQDLPVELQGSVTPTSEPASLVLFGTGAVVAILLATMSRRSLVESIPAISDVPALPSMPTPGRSWVRRGAAFHPAAPGAIRPSLQAASGTALNDWPRPDPTDGPQAA